MYVCVCVCVCVSIKATLLIACSEFLKATDQSMPSASAGPLQVVMLRVWVSQWKFSLSPTRAPFQLDSFLLRRSPPSLCIGAKFAKKKARRNANRLKRWAGVCLFFFPLPSLIPVLLPRSYKAVRARAVCPAYQWSHLPPHSWVMWRQTRAATFSSAAHSSKLIFFRRSRPADW